MSLMLHRRKEYVDKRARVHRARAKLSYARNNNNVISGA